MELPAMDISLHERKYVLDRLVEILAMGEWAELDLLYPEQVVAICKCDLRTLEAKGLPRVVLSPRAIRYRRADVEALIRSSFAAPAKERQKNFSAGEGRSGEVRP